VTHVSLSDGANAPLLCQGRPTARE
jgi:hypothetical protein